MDFTTAARVNGLLGDGATDNATVLGQIIDSVSASFERHMRRTVQRGAHTETIYHPRFKRIASLEAFPVTAITAIRYAPHHSDMATTTPLVATAYSLEPDAGFIRFFQSMPLDPGHLQIDYVGGMAQDTADLIASFPDLAEAADIQVIHEFKRRTSPGADVTFPGGSAVYGKDLEVIKRVQTILGAHRRHFI